MPQQCLIIYIYMHCSFHFILPIYLLFSEYVCRRYVLPDGFRMSVRSLKYVYEWATTRNYTYTLDHFQLVWNKNETENFGMEWAIDVRVRQRYTTIRNLWVLYCWISIGLMLFVSGTYICCCRHVFKLVMYYFFLLYFIFSLDGSVEEFDLCARVCAHVLVVISWSQT